MDMSSQLHTQATLSLGKSLPFKSIPVTPLWSTDSPHSKASQQTLFPAMTSTLFRSFPIFQVPPPLFSTSSFSIFLFYCFPMAHESFLSVTSNLRYTPQNRSSPRVLTGKCLLKNYKLTTRLRNKTWDNKLKIVRTARVIRRKKKHKNSYHTYLKFSTH